MPNTIIVDQLTAMRNRLIYHSMLGEYKEYVAIRKELAKKYILFPEEVRYIPRQKFKCSILSKFGRNVFKTWFRELFRTKTPEEKKMYEIAQELNAREKSGGYG